MNDFKFKAPIRTAFYIRVSTEEQDEKYGKDLQRTAMVDLLKSKAKLTDSNTEGYLPPKPEHIYYDDISGTKNREERPAMAKMCDDIINCSDGTTPFDVVFIFKLDRLARKLTILLDIIDFFESHNIQIVSARENIDTTTPFGRAMLGILGVIAELEIETIKDRTHSGKLSAVRKGVLMQDKYGFNRREGQIPTINIEEAPIITRIFKSFVYERLTIYEIAKQLTEEKISNPSFSKHPERYDKRNPKNPPYYWASETIRGLLKDYIYIGDYYYGKTKNKKDTDKENWVQSTVKVPQIVDTLLFEKAQELLCLHNRNIPQDDRKTYLLRGLLKCDDCFDPDKDLTGRVAWHGVPDKLDNGNVSYSYKCRRRNTSRGGSKICRMIPLPAKDIENYVIGFIKKLLANP